MCGIIGYVGHQPVVKLLLRGLDLLDYRGYDSAGIAVLDHDELKVVKTADPPRPGGQGGQGVTKLERLVEAKELVATVGIGHTRWATHGLKTDLNAHPHADCQGRLAVVHNGQITNHATLRIRLERQGHTFRSETDTEVIVHLVEQFIREGDQLFPAVLKTAKLPEGAFAFGVIRQEHPRSLIGARNGSPLVIGLSDHGTFLASDAEAFRASTDRFVNVADGEVALVEDQAYRVFTFDNAVIERSVQQVQYELEALSKGAYRTFMEKEIHEQPDVVERVLEGRLSLDGTIRLGGIERQPDFQRFVRDELTDIVILGCGTSLYAGYAITRFLWELGFRAQAIDAAEFTYAPMTLHPGTLVVPISQSGETKDLLEAMDRVRAAGLWSFALCNKPHTQLTSFGSGMYLMAGTEKAVASTKAFMAQVISGGLLGLALAQLRQQVNTRTVTEFGHAATQLKAAVAHQLNRADDYQAIGASLREVQRMFYIGRGFNRPVALEGALKMMEIAEMDAHGMSAAAMKHGPLALVHPEMVVVAIGMPDPRRPEIEAATLDNVNQVLSNGGHLIAVGAEHSSFLKQIDAANSQVRAVISVPDLQHGLLSALAVVPLQLMALGAAEARHKNPDRPRGLAKAVTVR